MASGFSAPFFKGSSFSLHQPFVFFCQTITKSFCLSADINLKLHHCHCDKLPIIRNVRATRGLSKVASDKVDMIRIRGVSFSTADPVSSSGSLVARAPPVQQDLSTLQANCEQVAVEHAREHAHASCHCRADLWKTFIPFALVSKKILIFFFSTWGLFHIILYKVKSFQN